MKTIMWKKYCIVIFSIWQKFNIAEASHIIRWLRTFDCFADSISISVQAAVKEKKKAMPKWDQWPWKKIVDMLVF